VARRRRLALGLLCLCFAAAALASTVIQQVVFTGPWKPLWSRGAVFATTTLLAAYLTLALHCVQIRPESALYGWLIIAVSYPVLFGLTFLLVWPISGMAATRPGIYSLAKLLAIAAGSAAGALVVALALRALTGAWDRLLVSLLALVGGLWALHPNVVRWLESHLLVPLGSTDYEGAPSSLLWQLPVTLLCALWLWRRRSPAAREREVY
jgi:hypothetical protein